MKNLCLLKFVIYYWIAGVSPVLSQPTYITDSLYQFYLQAPHDTGRAQILMKIGEAVHLDDPDSAIQAWQMARTIAEDGLAAKGYYSPDDRVTRTLLDIRASALYNIGYKLTEKGDAFSGTGYFEKALEIWEQLLPNAGSSDAFDINRAMAFTISNLGMLYGQLGDIKKELEYYYKSLMLAEKNNDTAGIGGALNNLGTVYYAQGDNAKAMENFHRSLKMREQINDKDGIAASLTNLGSAYGKTGWLDKELEYHHRAYRIWEEMGDKRGMAYALNNTGNVYRQMGNLPKTLEYFNRCMALREETGDKKNLAYSFSNTGTVYFDMSDMMRAHDFGIQSLHLSQELGSPENIFEAANLLKKIYSHQKKWDKAMEMLELSIQMRDSIKNEENRKAAMKQQFRYEWEKKEHELKTEHEKKEAVAKFENRRQKIVIGFVITCFLFAVIIAILISRNLRKSKRANIIITQQKEEIAEQKQNIVDSIEYARYIQQSMLPSGDEFKKLFPDSFIFFRPRNIVSGDFYWCTSVDVLNEGMRNIETMPSLSGGNHATSLHANNPIVLLACCDCTGHGVPGAFTSMLCNALLNEAVNVKGLVKPNEIFEEVRKGIIAALKQKGQTGGSKEGMDATIIALVNWHVGMPLVASLHAQNAMSLNTACANNPVYIVSNGILRMIQPDRFPVGIYEGEQKPFILHQTALQKGDMIYTLTDGFEDQLGGEKKKKFKSAKLKELLVTISSKPVAEQQEILEKTFEDWKDSGEQTDDITVIGVRI